MFFRRVFSNKSDNQQKSSSNRFNESRNIQSEEKPQRGISVLQLTPLWEHIIRTKTLPEGLNISEMFEEFDERLHDPEYQVRHHCLRVLVDVLSVMGTNSDLFVGPLIEPLVINLGHKAPSVRKGAMDVLRVYLSETQNPESVMRQILDNGLNNKSLDPEENDSGRLIVGLLLALPSLIHPTLLTVKRNSILRSVLDAVCSKMNKVPYQEISLKVLLKIQDMIGADDFNHFMPYSSKREFELLCNVYGLSDNLLESPNQLNEGNKWRSFNELPTNTTTKEITYWKSSDSDETDNEFNQHITNLNTNQNKEIVTETNGKVIMETEIKITDNTAVTMRILEAQGQYAEQYTEESDDSTFDQSPSRKRVVRFGGEVLKLITPDSDTVTQSDIENLNGITKSSSGESSPTMEKNDFLTIDIPNDNTKPITNIRPKTALPLNHSNSYSNFSDSTLTPNSPCNVIPPISPEQIRRKSQSANRTSRRLSVAPIEDILSPKPIHHEVQVLHNLQRSPNISPTRLRNNSETDDTVKLTVENDVEKQPVILEKTTWEDLGIVDDTVLNDLKSGDWRLRSRAFSSLEEALKPTENFALIQPHLESLLRALLSSEKNSEVSEDKRQILINLISRLPLENLENHLIQILIGICRHGGAGSNRIAKALMQRCPPAGIVLRLFSDEFLHARSSRFRENALQMVLYALMTFPSTYFDISTCVGRATKAAMDRKKRVRQAALDVLAVLGQISSPKDCIEAVNDLVKNRNDGENLSAAVKARLSRKHLPTIGSDGNVQYALRIPSPHSNVPNYLFGADIEWILAGGSSSSNRKYSQRNNEKSYENGSNENGYVIKAAFGNNSGSMSNWSKGSNYNLNDEGNLQSKEITTKDVNRSLYTNNRIQSQSFPELSKAVDNSSTKTVRQLSDSTRSFQPSKLPINKTRFPSMESKVNKNSIPDSTYYNPYQSCCKSNLSFSKNYYSHNNLPSTLGNDSQGTLNQSARVETRPVTHPFPDYPVSAKRFYTMEDSSDDRNNLKKEFVAFKESHHQNTDTTMEHQDNINKKTTHLEYSNDEKFTSDSGSTASSNYLIDSNLPEREVNSTSADSSPSTTPKRIFTANNDENNKFSQETSNPISRPQSVIPMSSSCSQRIDIEENLRPKTSLNNLRAQIPYDEIPIKSKFNSRETGINLNEFENNSKDDEFDEVDDVQEQRAVRPIIKMKSFRSKRSLKTSIPIKKPTIQAEKEKPEKPKDLLNNCLRQMDSSNWETTISGLKLFGRLIQKNPEIVESQLHTFSMVLGKHIRNLRSQVSRQACITSQEFFPMLKTSAKSELEADELALQLFYRTADTNKFLRGDANRALEVMCFNLSPTKVINILCSIGATHQNAIVKTVAARLLSIFVNRFSCDKIFSSSKENRDKIILTGANLLMEGSLETRNYSKEIFKELSLHPSYDKTILDVIPTKIYRNIEKTLKSLR